MWTVVVTCENCVDIVWVVSVYCEWEAHTYKYNETVIIFHEIVSQTLIGIEVKRSRSWKSKYLNCYLFLYMICMIYKRYQ
jgi:hypothetical protein